MVSLAEGFLNQILSPKENTVIGIDACKDN